MRSEKQSSEILVGEYQRRRQLERKISFWNASLICSTNTQSTRNIILAIVLCTSVVSNTLWPMDYSPPGSSAHGMFQATILEWDAIFSSRGSSQPRDQTCVSWMVGGFYFILFYFILFYFTTEPPGKFRNIMQDT